MLHAMAWLFVMVLLALWSGAAWLLHAVAAWSLSSAGALGGAAGGAFQLPAWLEPWLPAEWGVAVSAMLATAAPYVEGLLQAAPVLAGGVTVLAWGVWALGAVLLVGLGGALSLLIALWRRRAGPGAGGGALAAG